MTDALVIGAGPAGLMAAEELARAGQRVLVADAKPSPARKFLMAGKSGLNLTKDEPFEAFLSRYGEAAATLRPMLEGFDAEDVKSWVQELGQPLFTGSTGRVFPTGMKASPLLRAWLARLESLQVTLRTRWCWRGWEGPEVIFDTPNGMQRLSPAITILACGGVSWRRLGSDGEWMEHLNDAETSPFRPANMGFQVRWSDHMRPHFGAPVKGVALIAGETKSRGEFIISELGVEGGGVYEVAAAVRDGASLKIDLIPDLALDAVAHRLSKPRSKTSLSNHLRKTLRLDAVKQALLREFAHPLPRNLAPLVKALPIRHAGPRPMDEAISTAGGLRFDALDKNLMLRSRPGTFAAGEMLDWEAPTGGYLLTACLATGRWAGSAASRWLRHAV